MNTLVSHYAIYETQQGKQSTGLGVMSYIRIGLRLVDRSASSNCAYPKGATKRTRFPHHGDHFAGEILRIPA
ncbi:hypothetical protein M408DRAFT_143089 [Serendipita vermifera MAFF 305830]|uniref:Uncharacterized protein n=1 Tax=Serendipita vermifera MAFF 305830 TaxID=933852 RepID=A0A0C2WRU0_SERVB|nr:hypothetical protein M408DRAFT_143089 [Serendipita vermifera MAFF 305830]